MIDWESRLDKLTEELSETQFVEGYAVGIVTLLRDIAAERDACAAGPWRFDVENAPKDGSEIVGGWHEADGEFCHNKYRWDSGYEVWRWREPQYELVPFVVWTTINPPQVTP